MTNFIAIQNRCVNANQAILSDYGSDVLLIRVYIRLLLLPYNMPDYLFNKTSVVIIDRLQSEDEGTTGGNPNITTHSLFNHCMHHMQRVAEIPQNHIT